MNMPAWSSIMVPGFVGSSICGGGSGTAMIGATFVSNACTIRIGSLEPSRRMYSMTALLDFSNWAADATEPHSKTSSLIAGVLEMCLGLRVR
jgi:hypothetical protein